MRREQMNRYHYKGQVLIRMFVLMIAMLCMTSAFALPANAQNIANKRISLNLRTASVKDFFDEVNRQSGMNFFCKSELANRLPKITVVEENKPLGDVLEKVFNTLNCDYRIDGNVVTVTMKNEQYQRTVTGYVRDSSGEPLIGVTVKEEVSGNVSITDANGFYRIDIPLSAARLHFSYIGMNDVSYNFPKGSKDVTHHVTMYSDNRLDEVIVTGYQTISKERATGSFGTINTEQLERKLNSNLKNIIEGQVPGLVLDKDGNISIRGIST